MECPICLSPVTCSRSVSCWCMDYPKILESEASACLCEPCLKKRIQARIDAIIQLPELERRQLLDQMESMGKLHEGIHFVYNQAGLMVLSAWYLLRRGYCCGNGCQNCPY